MRTKRKIIYSETHIANKDKEPDESSISTHCFKRLRIMITLGLILRKIIEKKNILEFMLSYAGAKIQDGKGNQQPRPKGRGMLF